MNEEEKKAVEMLDTFRLEHKFFNIRQADNLEANIEIVLNLLEKLQKDNEELEEINNELEAEKNEAIRRYNFETIPIQKVKDKIEELKKQHEEELQEEIKVNSNRLIIICQCKSCLQELLGSEE